MKYKVIIQRKRLDFKRHFVSKFQVLKYKTLKKVKCHMGGGGHKSGKKCHVIFEWPLTYNVVKHLFAFAIKRRKNVVHEKFFECLILMK